MAGQGPVVPKFGSWDAENIGYTVFFDKVRENKTTPTPVAAAAAPRSAAYDDYEFDPYEHYENLVPSRSPSSHGHAPPPPQHRHHHRQQPPPPPQQQHHHYPAASQRGGNGGYHRRSGSNGSSCAPSEASSRGSKFSPPKPYQPRYTNSNNNASYPPAQHGGGYGGGAYAVPPQRHHYQHHQQQHAAAPARVVAASPPRHHAPAPVTKANAASAVPKFGVWDEQNAAAAGQGFTVQFEKVKRHREVAKAAAEMGAAAPAARHPRRKAKKSFLSKVYRCMFPRVRE